MTSSSVASATTSAKSPATRAPESSYMCSASCGVASRSISPAASEPPTSATSHRSPARLELNLDKTRMVCCGEPQKRSHRAQLVLHRLRRIARQRLNERADHPAVQPRQTAPARSEREELPSEEQAHDADGDDARRRAGAPRGIHVNHGGRTDALEV